MRILQISNKAPYPPNDGSSIAIYNMAQGFIQNEIDLHFLTINTKKHFKSEDEIPNEFKKRAKYKSIFKNTDVTAKGAFFNLFSSESYFVSRFHFKEFRDEIELKLKETKFDIIHLEGVFLGDYIPLIRKFSGAKIILRAHNVEHLIWERMLENAKNPIKKKYLQIQNQRLKNFESNVFSKVDAIITITKYDADFIKKMNPKLKVYNSPTGIDLQRYKIEKEKLEKGTVFHFGSMDWMPNLEAVKWFLNEVWKPQFLNQNNLKLVLAGRFMPEQIQKESRGNINVITEVKDNIDFYNCHEIMLVPLLSGSGLRIKIIEGMAMGKCIVSTGIGAEGIPVTNGKNILIANTKEEFSKYLTLLSQDDNLKSNLGKEARKFIEENFDNEKIVKALIHFYQTLL